MEIINQRREDDLKEKKYFPLLDGVRFFAAFWVMNFHYLFGLENSSDVKWYRYGNLGVQLFFIVSGFVIVQSLNGKTIGKFAFGRFVRLFPLFWILCTVTYLLTIVVPHANSLLFADYLRTMTMFGDTINEFNHAPAILIDPSYWTLTVELIFYIGIGMFVYLFSYKNIKYFLATWLIFCVTIFTLGLDHHFSSKLALVRHAPYFIFGSALALLVTTEIKNRYDRIFEWTLLIASGTYATYIIPKSIPAYLTPNTLDLEMQTILHITFFLGVLLLVYISKFIQNKKLLSGFLILGGLTYPLYLLHQTIGLTLINYITNTFSISRIYFILAFEVFIIAVAYLVFIQDEKMRKWLRKKFI